MTYLEHELAMDRILLSLEMDTLLVDGDRERMVRRAIDF